MEQSLRGIFRSSSLKVGHGIFEFVTPGIGHIVKNAGCDFAFLDMEHTGFTFETIKTAVRYFEAAHLPLLVRVPSKAYHHIARGLDVGAEGLMLPMVNDGAEAQQIVQAMRYTPQGGRGVALGIAHDNYRDGDVMATLAAANERTACIALIETAEGVQNAAEIAGTDGIDGVWIGHFDLSCALGVPGDFTCEAFINAEKRVMDAVRAAGKSLGRMGMTPDACRALHAAGYDTVCYSGDIWALRATLTEGVAQIKDGR